MLFKYKGFDKTGKKVKGTVTASSVEEAGQKLRVQDIYHEGLTPTKEFSLEAFSKRQMPGEMLSTFSKELSSYLNSGMTMKPERVVGIWLVTLESSEKASPDPPMAPADNWTLRLSFNPYS